MNTRFLRLLAVVPFLAVSFYAFGLTQDQWDRAVSCCWTNSNAAYCDTQNACAQGQTCCTSRYFNGIPGANNGNLSCSFFTGGAAGATQGQSQPGTESSQVFGAAGSLNLDADSNACGGPAPVASKLMRDAGPSPEALAPVAVDKVNADSISVERLFLEENESAGLIGFLPFNDRFAVHNDRLFAIGFSVDKGFELIEVRDVGGPKVRDLNPSGSSFAGFPHYDHRTLKGFDDKLWFYAQNAQQEFVFSALKSGNALTSADVDPAGDDVPLVYADGSGGLTYQDFHIDSFEVLRNRLHSAGSQRIGVLADDGSELVGPRIFDIEPQRVGRGKSPQAEFFDVTENGQSFPRNFVEFNGAVYFIAKTAGGYAFCGDGRDYELARLNDDGSSEIIEINPDGWGFYPDLEYPPMQVVGDDLYLVANIGPDGADRHELVRVTPSHDVSVVPVNPDGGAFRNIDEIFFSFSYPDIGVLMHPRGDDLYVFGAHVAGSCAAGCPDPYQPEIVKVSPGGAVTAVDPTPGASTFPTFDPGFFAPVFVAQEFNGDSYFLCGFCNERQLYRLNGDDTLETFPEWPVTTLTSNGERVIGVERDGKFYFEAHRLEFDPVFVDEWFLVRVDQDGTFNSLTSPDLGFNFIYDMLVVDDTIVMAANIFSEPDWDFETNFLGGELLILHPDDTLGYVEIAPGFDGDGFPNASYPQGLRKVGDALTFASYTDPTFESPYVELFRVQFNGKGHGRGPRTASLLSTAMVSPSAAEASRPWPSVRPPAAQQTTAGLDAISRNDSSTLLEALEANPRLSGGHRARDEFVNRTTLARRPADLAWTQMRAGPATEAYAAHARRIAEARRESRLPVASCAARVD